MRDIRDIYDHIVCDPNSGCWLWGGGATSRRYGAAYVDGRQIPAHRLSKKIEVGEISDDILVLHKCDTPACVNPKHLFLGTQLDNVRDCISKGRQSRFYSSKTACRHGHPYTEDNLYKRPDGFRGCAECRRKNVLAWYYRQRQAGKSPWKRPCQ